MAICIVAPTTLGVHRNQAMTTRPPFRNCKPSRVRTRSGLVHQLAQIVADIEQKSALCTLLRQQVEELQRVPLLPVAGEMALLQTLTNTLEQVRSLFQMLQSPAPNQTMTDQMVAIQALLQHGQWAAATLCLQDLTAKQQRHAAARQTFQARLALYQQKIITLRSAIEQADQAHAPWRKQELLLKQLEALLTRAARALDGQQDLNDLIMAIKALDEKTPLIPAAVQELTLTTNQAEQFSRQADLLLLQAPLDEHNRYHYSVLLSTPSTSGVTGINVYDTSTLIINQDRTRLKAAIHQITVAVENGMLQSIAPDAQQLSSTTATADASPDTTPATDAPTRTFISGDDTDDANLPLDGLALARQSGELLYRLLIPEQMQHYLHEPLCALTITTNDLELPWEFLYSCPWGHHATDLEAHQADEQNFLCLNRPVARMPMGRVLPTRLEITRANRPPKRQFLLICSDPLNNLPSAHREIESLQRWLATTWQGEIDVDVLQGPDATGEKLNKILATDKYDVIHYSGHAYFDEQEPDQSGLLLYDQEPFDAQKIRRLLEGRPFVFLNACQSAMTANEQDGTKQHGYSLAKPAEGLAAAFIYGGALGCIGSLWPIYDEPAAAFAIEFYQHVLEGQMIGEAMRRTRCAIKQKDALTWAAFALYGDPTFRLVD